MTVIPALYAVDLLRKPRLVVVQERVASLQMNRIFDSTYQASHQKKPQDHYVYTGLVGEALGTFLPYLAEPCSGCPGSSTTGVAEACDCFGLLLETLAEQMADVHHLKTSLDTPSPADLHLGHGTQNIVLVAQCASAH